MAQKSARRISRTTPRATTNNSAPKAHDPEHVVHLSQDDYFYRTVDGRYYGHVGLWRGYAEDFVRLTTLPMHDTYLVGETSGVKSLANELAPYLEKVRLLVAEEHIYRPDYHPASPYKNSPKKKNNKTTEVNHTSLYALNGNVELDENDTIHFTIDSNTVITLCRVVATSDLFIHNIAKGERGGYASKKAKFTGCGWVTEGAIMAGGSVNGAGIVTGDSVCIDSNIEGRVVNSRLEDTNVNAQGIILASEVTGCTLNGLVSTSTLKNVSALVDSRIINSTIESFYTVYMNEVVDSVHIKP